MEAGPLDSLFEPEQLALFALPDAPPPSGLPTGAEMCAFYFASMFRRRYQDLGSPERISEDLETLCLACLLLISDYEVRPTTRLLHELVMCRDSLQTMQTWRVYDALPFDICLQLLGQPGHGLNALQRNFTHHISGVRGWMFDLGWFVRRHLIPEATGNRGATFSLLKNVEDTLGFWDSSLALCRSLYSTNEAFWSGVVFYQAETMPEQFAKRMEWARSHMGQMEWHSVFTTREAQV
jgi:hypothetical protein